MNFQPKYLIKGDRVIWIIFFLLCLISLVEVFSATSTLVYKQGVWGPILKHAAFLAGGAFLIVLVQNIPYNIFKVAIPFGWPLAVGCLSVVLLMQRMTNGAARWLDLGPFQFQPSEMAKGVAVIFVANTLAYARDKNGYASKVLTIIGIGTLPILALILPENLSTAVILSIVILIMLFVGKIPNKQLYGILLFGIAGITLVATLIFAVPQTTYQKLEDKLPAVGLVTHRIITWKNRFADHERIHDLQGQKDGKTIALDIYGKDAQRTHANIAIATSNVIGKVPGNSVERDFLSQAYSDFIYAIIVEEMGLIGGCVVIILYIFLLVRAAKIAHACTEPFPAYLVIGLTLLIVIQALINMMVAVGLMPITGQPLPLISRGGTSTLFNCIYIGMILSVSRAVRQRLRNSKKSLKTAPEVESGKKS